MGICTIISLNVQTHALKFHGQTFFLIKLTHPVKPLCTAFRCFKMQQAKPRWGREEEEEKEVHLLRHLA